MCDDVDIAACVAHDEHDEHDGAVVHALPSTFDYYTERYYHHYVVRNCKGVAGNHCRLLLHSNGLCVVCLDTTHDAVVCAARRRHGSNRCRSSDATRTTDRDDSDKDADATVTVTSVIFGSSRSCRQHAAAVATVATATADDGSSSSSSTRHATRAALPAVIGKRKRNAQRCQPDTRLCTVQLSSGASYVIPACVHGIVLETNAQLQQRPDLIVREPLHSGYVAVLQPSLQQDWSAFTHVWTATAGEAALVDEDDAAAGTAADAADV